MSRPVRVGVLGLRRGADLARLAQQAGMRVVAVCERDDQRRDQATAAMDATGYRELEAFLANAIAEGVALIEAAEHSSGIYMFAENYPYMPFAREMRRRYAAGDIGEVRYAEAEYLDEPADLAAMAGDRGHWRARRGRGWAALLVVHLDNGAVLKSLHGFLQASQQA